MTTDVGIANTALRRLKANTITSFTEGTKSANCVNDLYDSVRDELLRAHNWNFATKREKLAQSATAPAFGYDNAYSMPSDWIRTVSAHPDDSGIGTVEFKEENQDDQNVILCDADDVYLRYISRVTDPNRMPADFVKAFARSLAEAMAMDLANSNTVRAECEKEAEILLRRAKSSDAMGSTPERRPSGSWATSRGGWR